MKKIPDIINRLWNVCGQMEVGALLTCGSGINRPYFSRPRKYRRLFSKPTYWPRRSRGQYGEGNNQAGIFEAEGNKSLIPGKLTRSPLTCPLVEKCETKELCLCVASAAMLVQVVRGRRVRNGLIDFFPPAIVSSQIAQVDRPKILERMVFGSSPLLSGVFVTFFSFKLRTKKNSKSFGGEIMKKIPDIINRLWNVCGQMEVGALLTCGSGIKFFKKIEISGRPLNADRDNLSQPRSFSSNFMTRTTKLTYINYRYNVIDGSLKKLRYIRLSQRKRSRQTSCCNSHNLIFALFSSVAVQREQRKNQEQGNIYKDLSVRSCAESACVNPGRKHEVDHRRREATQRRGTTLRLPVIWLQTRHAVGATRLVTFRCWRERGQRITWMF